MKKTILLLLFLSLALSLSACGGEKGSLENPMAQWEEKANLTAEETPEQLYAAALNEDTLVVYSTSSRMLDVAASFQKQYPGLFVQVADIREYELYEKLREDFDAGTTQCDVICSADGRGMMTHEFVPDGVVYKYTPYDMKDKFIDNADDEVLMLANEAAMLYYNDTYYDEQPVTNWWELTEEQWRGKVTMPNPARSQTTMAAFGTFIKESDAMEKAYEERYGKPIELPNGESAGEAFVRELVENDVVIVNASDEVAEAVGAPGTASATLGIMVSSKMRLKAIGYNLHYCEEMAPFDGVATPINIMMTGGAKNVNAAKLFIRWVLGETDGTGEGYKPYLQSGAWSMRTDVASDAPVQPEDLELIYIDREYIYAHKDDISSLWEQLMIERHQ
jgi:iron(III) transport system substrate-binding protein